MTRTNSMQHSISDPKPQDKSMVLWLWTITHDHKKIINSGTVASNVGAKCENNPSIVFWFESMISPDHSGAGIKQCQYVEILNIPVYFAFGITFKLESVGEKHWVDLGSGFVHTLYIMYDLIRYAYSDEIFMNCLHSKKVKVNTAQ